MDHKLAYQTAERLIQKVREEPYCRLAPPFASILTSMYHGEPQQGSDGQFYDLDKHSRVSVQQGMWLYKLYCQVKPKTSLEIGLAFGFSTVFFLAALAKNGSGHHTAIDPHQKAYHGIGKQKILQTGFQNATQVIEEYSFRAAIDLLRAGRSFEFIFIDGNHRFDDVLGDFTLFAEVCPIGGFIIFDDMWMPSVQTAVAFIRTNRNDFIEMPTPIANISVFQRTSPDLRNWDDFKSFPVKRETIDIAA